MFRSGLLTVIFSLLWIAPSRAQSSQVPIRCSQSSVVKDDPPHRKVVIEGIQFDGPIHLSDSDIQQIVVEENKREWDADRPGWVEELTEISLRGAWQDRGYFLVNVSAEAHSVGGDSSEERFLLTAHVHEGLQYHLGDLRFTGGTAIPEPELQAVFPLRGGELFDVALVRKGIDALTKLYGSHGYIDFTVVPNTEVDDNLQRISLVMHLDEQRQFRVGDLKIEGLDPGLDARLRSIIKSGDIIDFQALEDFAKENRSILPSRFLDGMEARRNVMTGIVDITFDFRPCPDANPQDSTALHRDDFSR
jgi:outer membrane protein assembly factor BamA